MKDMKHDRSKQKVASDRLSTSDYWQGRFERGDTPWELGRASQTLLEGFDELERLGHNLKDLRVLSPGCGRGSDAIALAQRGARVVALDWSSLAVTDLMEKIATLDRSVGSVEVVVGDFFASEPRLVDCVAEHTFFCAIDPSARARYVERIASWIKPGGFVVGNFFIVSDEEAARLPGRSLTQHEAEPPFATTVSELEGLMSPFFRKALLRPATQQEDNRRPGLEWVGLFERTSFRS